MKAINKKQSGFTLIELIMVIVILGILSAFALPKFADLGNDARIASLEGLSGALKSAAAVSHAEWLAGGGAAVVLEGSTITMTATGYPDAVAAGITTAAQVDTGAYTASADAAGLTITYTIQTGCTVTYDASPTVAAGPPDVAVNSGSC